MNCWVVTCFHPPNWHFPLSGSYKTFHFSYKKFLCPLKFRCSNKSLGVYWRLVKIFASATSRTTSVWHDFLRLVAGTKFCCGDNDFQKKLSSTHEAICRCDVSPHRVAATSRPTCTHGVICRRDELLQRLQLVAKCVPTFKDSKMVPALR